MSRFAKTLTACCLALCATRALAQESSEPGQVRIPLAVYNELVERARDPEHPEAPAPAGYALGQARVRVDVSEDAHGGVSAEVETELQVRVLEDRWVAVPLLAAGTAISSASVDSGSIELVNTPAGLAFVTQDAGNYRIALEYSVDGRRSDAGASLAIPVPAAGDTTLQASLPGQGLDVAVIPSAGMSTSASGSNTTVKASIPSTRGIQLSYRVAGSDEHTISRARYSGSLVREAVRFDAELEVDLPGDRSAEVELLPTSVALSALAVDGKPATIQENGDRFVALVRGRGKHQVKLGFEVPVVRGDGPPHVELSIPRVPVSRLDIALPGNKEVKLEPAANVTAVTRGATTVSTAYLPMTESVTVAWAEAVPEAVAEELLANANIFHLVHAEEGVLYVRARVQYEVTSGRTNVLEIEIPEGVQVADVRSDEGGIKKAIPKRGARGQVTGYSVFLDRELEGEFRFDVFYEQKLQTGDGAAPSLTVPVIRASGVNRQRGMVALLSSKELTLKPDAEKEKNVTRVGENQLPAFVRESVDKTVAHTYKYLEEAPTLVVSPAPPERKEGKFDARVDTLVSLGDVTLRGAATVEVNVKSGSLEVLQLVLPEGVNFLSLTAPSLRTHKPVESGGGEQVIEVQFTQEMDGQFRIELAYEKIAGEAESELTVPTVRVRGAEVEQGRIAVEALSAVEVGEGARDHLSPLDPSELPQQLVLKTTNPILRAYKYVQAEPAPKLSLKVTRHKEVAVLQATIDRAHYQTLFTKDGLAVTTARFDVRNSREQFLRVRLPEGSKVWSAFVSGHAEKLAVEEAEKGDARPVVLIKIINSSDGFPVELVYETPISRIGALGQLSGRLPTPEMVVTESVWDVYVPRGLSYGEPTTNMELVAQGAAVSAADMKARLSGEEASRAVTEPLRIQVPTDDGVRFSFKKLYANRGDEPAEFAMSYASSGGATLANVLALLGTLVFWVGLGLAWLGLWTRRKALSMAGGGVLLVVLATGYFGGSMTGPMVLTLLVPVAGLLGWLIQRGRKNASAQTPPAG